MVTAHLGDAKDDSQAKIEPRRVNFVWCNNAEVLPLSTSVHPP